MFVIKLVKLFSQNEDNIEPAVLRKKASEHVGKNKSQIDRLLQLVEAFALAKRDDHKEPSTGKSGPVDVSQIDLEIVQAVRIGDLQLFQSCLNKYTALFQRDATYSLIVRLRHNVIKTGIRMISLSYSRISLLDITRKLGLESEEDAEYIVAKAIRDGVIEAKVDHEKGWMISQERRDVYSTEEPRKMFETRIEWCLGLRNESVKAMRYSLNGPKGEEMEKAEKAREREREVANQIADGDLSDDPDNPGKKLTPSQRRRDLGQLDECIDSLGGRLTDLEFLARRIKTGETPQKAVDEMIESLADETDVPVAEPEEPVSDGDPLPLDVDGSSDESESDATQSEVSLRLHAPGSLAQRV